MKNQSLINQNLITMKRFFHFLTLICVILFSGCSKDDDNSFDYDENILIGYWRITDAEFNGTYYDLLDTNFAEGLKFAPSYIIFKNDYNYEGRGSYGAGYGTYKLDGKKIDIILYGDELIYEIISLTDTDAEFRVIQHKKDDPYKFTKIKLKKNSVVE